MTIDEIMALASEVEDQGLIHACGEVAEPIAERDALRHAITAALAAKDAEIEVLARWKSTNAPRLDALAGLLDAARANEVKGAEAIASLDSERAANAILTEEIERLKTKLADSDKQEPAAWRIRQGARVYIISNAEFVRSSFDAASMTPLYEKPQPAAKPAKPAPGEWIEWAGGECPIADGVRHQIKMRDGYLSSDDMEARSWIGWDHTAGENDIVAYRVLA